MSAFQMHLALNLLFSILSILYFTLQIIDIILPNLEAEASVKLLVTITGIVIFIYITCAFISATVQG